MQEAPRFALLDMLTRPIGFAPLLLVLSAGASYVYADRNMPIPDEGAYLTAAVKLLHGAVFYRDLDSYAFPGVSYLLAGLMALFGEQLSLARGLAGSFYCATVLGVYACALALMDRRRAALCGLALLSIKFFAFPIYTMFYYATPSLAAAVLALALFLRHPFSGPSLRLFAAGVAVGLSIVTKQSTGLYVASVFGLVLCFPGFAHGPARTGARARIGELSAYAAGVALVIGSMSAYFASYGLFDDMVRSGIMRPFTGYLTTSGVSFLPPLEWWRFGEFRFGGTVYLSQLYWELAHHKLLPGEGMEDFYWGLGELAARVLYSAIPVVFGCCAWLWLRAFRASPTSEPDAAAARESTLARARFFSAAGVSLAITISAFPRTDFIHVITIYPVVVLMLFALCRPSLMGQGWKMRGDGAVSPQRLRQRVEAAFVACLLATTLFLGLRYDATLTHSFSTDRVDLWVRPKDAWLGSLVDYVQREVPAGEPLFVYGHEAHWYYLSDRYSPHRFPQLYPGMTGDSSGEQLAAMIRETRPRVILQGVMHWKGMPSVPPYTKALARTIDQLYEVDPKPFPNPPPKPWLRVWRLRD